MNGNTFPPAATANADTALRAALDRQALLLAAGAWCAFFLIRSSIFLFAPGDAKDWRSMSARLLASVCGMALCLAIHALLRRRARPAWRTLLWALALALPATAVLDVAGALIWRAVSDHYVRNPQLWLSGKELAEDYLTYLWVFFCWSALYAGAASAIEVRRRDRQLAAAQAAAQESRLQALQLQIHPHFLFNTLNTLAGLIALGRNADSENMVLTLARFLRRTLSSPASQFVTLGAELDLLREYLALESLRFGERLRVRITLPPDCANALVPSLILLPLVENAIKHGLAASEDGIDLAIGAARTGEQLQLWVEDNGEGSRAGGLGIGLANVRQRLAACYGNAVGLQAGALARGWRSSLTLPWQVAG
jgi:two-component system, LytTR family, sensor kinase